MNRIAIVLSAILMALVAANVEAAKKWLHCYAVDECEITQENLIGPLFRSGDAKASKRASQRVASACMAAGFTHYQTVDSSSREGKRGFGGELFRGGGQNASTTIRAKFFHEEVEGSYPCSFAATKEYTKEARKIGKKNGYPWPVAPDSE